MWTEWGNETTVDLPSRVNDRIAFHTQETPWVLLDVLRTAVRLLERVRSKSEWVKSPKAKCKNIIDALVRISISRHDLHSFLVGVFSERFPL